MPSTLKRGRRPRPRHLPGVGRLQRWLTPWVVHTGVLWVVTDGGHTGALTRDATEYERCVVDFLDRALLS